MVNKLEWKNLLFYGFITVYAALLIFLAVKLNVWEDEAYSLHTTSNNLVNVIKQSYDFEGQPPFYFLLLAIWRHINSGIFFARLLSLFFIGFSAYFFYRLVCLVSGVGSSRWLLVIFLLNPFTVWAGLEIRLYALAIFLSIVLMYYFFRFYIENKSKDLKAFFIISLLGLYTQYFFSLEILTLAFSLLIFKGWKVFFRFCLYQLPLLVFFIPNLFFIHQQVNMLQSHKIEYSTLQRFSAVLHSPQELLLALQVVPFKAALNRVIRGIFIFLAIFAYYKLYKKQAGGRNLYFRNINIILFSSSALIFLYCLLVAVTGIIFQIKYFAIVFPLIILTITLFKVYPYFKSSLIFMIISIYYISLNIFAYKTPIKNFDFKSVGKFVGKIERSKEPILLYDKSLLPPFTYYYTGSNLLIPLPAINYDHNYYEENIYDTLELKKAIQKINSLTKSYILLTDKSDGYKYNLQMDEQMIDQCLRSNYNVTLDTIFLGENKNHTLRVRRLQIR